MESDGNNNSINMHPAYYINIDNDDTTVDGHAVDSTASSASADISSITSSRRHKRQKPEDQIEGKGKLK